VDSGVQYMVKMNVNRSDYLDGDYRKGDIQGGACRTTLYLSERCRPHRPSGPVNTPEERVPINKFVQRGG